MRKLIKGNTYWDEVGEDFELHPVEKDLDTDILIIGAGMSGTLAAHVLSKETSFKIAMVDAMEDVAMGSSRANTGLLQVSSDTMLHEFIETIGEKKGRGFYRMCQEAMEDLISLGKSLPGSTLRSRKSLYCATQEADVEKIKKEYDALTEQGMSVTYLEPEDVLNHYGVRCYGALLILGDADVNPVVFIDQLTKGNLSRGVKIYNKTEMDLDSATKNEIKTKTGHRIIFKHLIFATGYAKKFEEVEDLIQINRTYAFTTKPVKEEPWPEEVMIWETKSPYLYLRTTQDQKIVVGGRDEEVDGLMDEKDHIDKVFEKLKKDVDNLFVNPPKLNIDHRYNALFGTVKDGLPLMGRDPDVPNHYYILGYEGNGTCYSMAGAKIILNLLQEREDPYEEIVRLNRKRL
ncbi:MAG: FAD-dependent oxidoreductase [Clostridium sp.]|nr:FAD-dependent oxidoreductase [Clostridium sp.]